jgi:branched-chain amino acid transport system substrate-binding protein
MQSKKTVPVLNNKSTSARRLTWLWLISLVLLAGLLGCSNSRTAPDPIRIGMILPLSGDLAALGEAAVKAANLKIERINESGGLEVNGRRYQIELLVADDAGLPEEAIEATRHLIFTQNVVAIIGPMISRTAIPATLISEEAQIPMLLPNATNPEATVGKQFVYRVAFIDSFQGSLMAAFARENLKAQTTAVLYDTANKYNHDMAHIYREAFTASGGEVVAFESYVTGTTDFSRQIEAIKTAEPDVIFLPNYAYELLLQVEQIRTAGIEATLIGGDGWSGILPENLPLIEGSFFSGHYASDLPDEQAAAFQLQYEQAYNEVPGEAAALTFDGVGLLLQVIQNTGVTPEAIQAGMQELERFAGVTGTMLYGSTGDPNRSAVLLRVVNGNVRHYQTIDPDEFVEE